MKVEVLATGSKGNCYQLTSGEKRILLDCGLAYNKILKLLDFKLPDAVMVTHEHKDHAHAAQDFIKHGVDVYMTTGTAMALGLEKHHRLHLIKSDSIAIESDSIAVESFEVNIKWKINHTIPTATAIYVTYRLQGMLRVEGLYSRMKRYIP